MGFKHRQVILTYLCCAFLNLRINLEGQWLLRLRFVSTIVITNVGDFPECIVLIKNSSCRGPGYLFIHNHPFIAGYHGFHYPIFNKLQLLKTMDASRNS